MRESELRVALKFSGGGTTMEAAARAWKEGRIPGVDLVAAIASRSDAAGIKKAQSLGIPTFIIERKGISQDQFGDNLLSLLQDLHVDLVSQNGWLPYTPSQVVEAYEGMIINQHPAPNDPGRKLDFGGKGMHGRAPHCARIAYLWMSGEKTYTESNIHFVTTDIDGGDLISVVRMELPWFDFVIDPSDLNKEKYQQELLCRTVESQAKLLPLEHQNVISVLQRFGEGEVKGYRREIPLIPSENHQILEKSKEIAKRLYPNG